MSTEIFAFPNASYDIPNVRSGKYLVVRSEQEHLHDFVRRTISDKGLSYREVTEGSGGRISPATISDIINQRVRHVRTETLTALAKGLQVSEDEIFAIARGKSLSESEAFDNEIYVLFSGFEELSDKDKAEMLATVRMLGSEIQRRRPKRPPDKGKGKGKGKK